MRNVFLTVLTATLLLPTAFAYDPNPVPNWSFEYDGDGDNYPDGWGRGNGDNPDIHCSSKWSHDWLEGLRSLHIEIDEGGRGGVCAVRSDVFPLAPGTYRFGAWAKGTLQAYIGVHLYCLDAAGAPIGGSNLIYNGALGGHAWSPHYEYRTCPQGTVGGSLELYLLDRRYYTDTDGEDAWFDLASVTRA